jgi:hypothetical protein
VKQESAATVKDEERKVEEGEEVGGGIVIALYIIGG